MGDPRLSRMPAKWAWYLGGLGRALQKRGARIFQEAEAEAAELSDGQISVFCSNGAHVQAGQVFMANAFARHINPEVFERSIFSYDYVVMIDLPDGAQTLASASVQIIGLSGHKTRQIVSVYSKATEPLRNGASTQRLAHRQALKTGMNNGPLSE
jgi:hypothetical protein